MKIKLLILTLAIIIAMPLVAAEQPEIIDEELDDGEVNQEYSYLVNVNLENVNMSEYGDILFNITQHEPGMELDKINNTNANFTWTPTETGDFNFNASIYNDTIENETLIDSNLFELTVEAEEAEFNAEDVELGSSNQRRSETTSTTYEVENTGSYTIENFTIEDNIADKYNFTISNVPSNIEPKETIEVDIEIDVPSDQRAGEERLGRITIDGDSTGPSSLSSTNRDVYLETRNNLIIDELDVRVDGRRDRMTSDGLIDRVAQMDSEIEMELVIENRGDIDIEDIDVFLDSRDIRAADGLEDSIRRIRPDRTDSNVRFEFQLDPEELDFDLDIYEMELEIRGYDENNARHGELWDLELEVERETRDVRFISTSLSTNTVSCENTDFRAETRIRNIGERDLSDANVRVFIDELDIDETTRNIDLDRGEARNINFNLEIDEDASPGDYFVNFETRPRRGNSNTDIDIRELTVEECPDDVDETEPVNGEDDFDLVTDPIVIGEPTEREDANDRTYIIILSALAVIVLMLIVLIIIKLLEKK